MTSHTINSPMDRPEAGSSPDQGTQGAIRDSQTSAARGLSARSLMTPRQLQEAAHD